MRFRRFWMILFIAIIAFGLISRFLRTGFVLWDKYLGDALYAAMVYVLIRLVLPKARAWQVAMLSMAIMTGLELFQLTMIPAQMLASPSLPVRMAARLLGTEFSVLDLLAYALGIGAILLVDRAARAPRDQRPN